MTTHLKLTPKQAYYVLETLCVRFGLCIPPEDCRKIEDNPPRTVDEFVRAVFVVEGLDPDHPAHRDLRRASHEAVAKHFKAFSRGSTHSSSRCLAKRYS